MDGALQMLKTILEEDLKARVEYNGNGNSPDYATYRENGGFIRGLGTAIQHINDLAKRMEQQDDD